MPSVLLSTSIDRQGLTLGWRAACLSMGKPTFSCAHSKVAVTLVQVLSKPIEAVLISIRLRSTKKKGLFLRLCLLSFCRHFCRTYPSLAILTCISIRVSLSVSLHLI